MAAKTHISWADATANKAAAEAHIRTIQGPTILMGDGSYFDYLAPHLTTMTIEDYAWGLAASGRFAGQTRLRSDYGRRCIYNVAQHCCLLTAHMMADGYPREDCFAGLMHESDEVSFPDVCGPIKGMLKSAVVNKERQETFGHYLKLWASGIDAHFGVVNRNPDLIKMYDIRMLSTEKRDLMPQGENDNWTMLRSYEPFSEIIGDAWTPEQSVDEFVSLYLTLKPDSTLDGRHHIDMPGGA